MSVCQLTYEKPVMRISLNVIISQDFSQQMYEVGLQDEPNMWFWRSEVNRSTTTSVAISTFSSLLSHTSVCTSTQCDVSIESNMISDRCEHLLQLRLRPKLGVPINITAGMS
ncbi:hypothetical protein AMECASPLE_009361 [Ameca splendens]|uniref:Uncharacterized protein n=1 Tax=Ameca splendens TaxID=208324 RepID=A0ABV0YMA3_9TELE